MKYIIKETQIEKFIFQYINETFSNLYMKKYNQNYFWFKKDGGEFMWEYVDNGYGLSENIYYEFLHMFSLTHTELSEFLNLWLTNNMPFPFDEIYTVD